MNEWNSIDVNTHNSVTMLPVPTHWFLFSLCYSNFLNFFCCITTASSSFKIIKNLCKINRFYTFYLIVIRNIEWIDLVWFELSCFSVLFGFGSASIMVSTWQYVLSSQNSEHKQKNQCLTCYYDQHWIHVRYEKK